MRTLQALRLASNSINTYTLYNEDSTGFKACFQLSILTHCTMRTLQALRLASNSINTYTLYNEDSTGFKACFQLYQYLHTVQ